MADLAPGQVNRYEAGKNVPRPHVAGRLAGALSVFPEWLLLGKGPRDTGSTTAYRKRLEVSTTMTPDGGIEIGFSMNPKLYALFSKRAAAEGLDVVDFLKKELLDRLSERAEDREGGNIDELARKVKALIQADETPKTGL